MNRAERENLLDRAVLVIENAENSVLMKERE